MARGRFTSTSIAIDDRLNSLSIEAQLYYLLAIPHLDRDGLHDGRPDVVWAAWSPLRPELRNRVEAILDEWTDSGLVVRYASGRTPTLFFPSFTRHQNGMRYERETPSRFAPPPGYRRTIEGLVPADLQVNSVDQPSEIGSQHKLRRTSPVSADKVWGNSGNTPAEVKDQHQVEVEVQVEDQGKSKYKDNHHHHQEAPRAARQSDVDDDGVSLSLEEPDLERIAHLPLDRLRVAALNHINLLPAWVGSRQFIIRSDGLRLASLLTWLRLFTIFHEDAGFGPRVSAYRTNPFKGVANPIGKIITQARERSLAPLLPIDLDELLAELEDAATSKYATTQERET